MTRQSFPIDPVIRQVRERERAVELDLSLPDDLFYFQGHFPDQPVLPGVTQIDWAVRFADRHLATQIGAARIFQVKFRSIIRPDTKLTLVLELAEDGSRLRFEYRNQENVLSSGAIRLDGGS